MNLRGEVLKCLRKTLIYYVTTTFICYVDDINTFVKRFGCPSCDTFIQKAGLFNRHVKKCEHRVQHIYPRSVYTLRETLFDKLDGFGISYNDDQKLFKNLAIFYFE